MLNSKDGVVKNNEPLMVELDFECYEKIDALKIRTEFRTLGHGVAISCTKNSLYCESGEKKRIILSLDTSQLSDGLYQTAFVLYEQGTGYTIDLDSVLGIVFHKIIDDTSSIKWNPVWGNVQLPDAETHSI